MAHDNDELLFALDTLMPDPLIIGKGNVLHLRGWCFHTRQRIKTLEVLANGAAFQVRARTLARPDVWEHFRGRPDRRRYSYHSGFQVTIPFSEPPPPEKIDLWLRATLRDGAQRDAPLAGVVAVARRSPSPPLPQLRFPSPDGSPRVVICMATHRPPLELFRRQIRSIIDQTHRNWICLLSDDASPPEVLTEIEYIIGQDERFLLLPAGERLGFYHNFERCLSFVTEEANYVALADQDDYWYPHKLQTQLAAFGEQTALVYSDMRLVDERGRTLSDTYWTMRRNNSTDLAALLLANTASGAGLMFRRDLLDTVLPFPPRVGQLYHDHWIGSVALAKGEIACVAEPLYDYTRHAANVSDYHGEPKGAWPHRVCRLLKSLLTEEGRLHAGYVYYELLLRAEVMARVAALRCEPHLTPAKKRALRRLSAIGSSLATFFWLILRGIRDWRRMSLTDGAEYELLTGILWKYRLRLEAWLGTRRGE